MPVTASRQVVLAAMISSSLTLVACRAGAPASDGNAPAPANVAEAPVQPKLLPVPEARLDREALLIAAIRARSALASGKDAQAAQAELDGKKFEFRIRLGCSLSADPPAGIGQARYNEQERRVELQAAPDLALDQPIVAAMAGEGVEAVEGFWIPRPWLLEPSCAGADPAQPAVIEQPQVALAQFYTEADARTERRDGRSYEARQTLAEGEAPTAGSWDLVLRGRLKKTGGESVIACRSTEAGSMPVCLISAVFEEVVIENVSSGDALARWSRG